MRVLAIDGYGPGPGDALLAVAALARLEAALRPRAREPDARVADFFDATTGAGAGGVLAVMLFLKGDDGRSRYTAADALAFMAASLGKGGGAAVGGASRSFQIQEMHETKKSRIPSSKKMQGKKLQLHFSTSRNCHGRRVVWPHPCQIWRGDHWI